MSAPSLRHSQSSDSEDSRDQESADIRDYAPLNGGTKVDKVYSVGCFDLFHRGHQKLLKNMRKLGKEVSVMQHTQTTVVVMKELHLIVVMMLLSQDKTETFCTNNMIQMKEHSSGYSQS